MKDERAGRDDNNRMTAHTQGQDATTILKHKVEGKTIRRFTNATDTHVGRMDRGHQRKPHDRQHTRGSPKKKKKKRRDAKQASTDDRTCSRVEGCRLE